VQPIVSNCAYCAKNSLTDLSGLYRSLRSKNITVEQVRSISQILNHNFFDDYYSAAKHPGSNTEHLVNENRQLKAKLHQLETDLSYFRNFVDIMKTKQG
jgi:hypothetical protein